MSHDVTHFFSERGPLERALGSYEPRPAQSGLAEAVADDLRAGDKLVAEAGTGTGKTLAYLMPALASGLKVVVSTATKNLQEQILAKDLPLLEKALGRRFEVEVMKGRANYLCELRAERVLAQLRLPGMDTGALDAVRAWRETTQTGDKSELRALPDDAPLWRELSATREQCIGRACPHYDRCWVTQMRRRAQVAELVVANHHLYLADAALRQELG
ncbi:MAG TPA: DEAD/DEAH box helicase, partial [Myxococcota bacterium]|nr:DEAD/DEAH box helicase [Myxococcota bacterium]